MDPITIFGYILLGSLALVIVAFAVKLVIDIFKNNFLF